MTASDYRAFLEAKVKLAGFDGFDVDVGQAKAQPLDAKLDVPTLFDLLEPEEAAE